MLIIFMANQIREQTRLRIMGLLQSLDKSCSVSYIEKNLNIDYDSVLKVLNELIEQNKVRKIETSAGAFYEWIK